MTSKMLKKAASGVLVSLRGSTYRSVRLASLLAAALLDSLFEHPEIIVSFTPNGKFRLYFWHQQVSRSLLEGGLLNLFRKLSQSKVFNMVAVQPIEHRLSRHPISIGKRAF